MNTYPFAYYLHTESGKVRIYYRQTLGLHPISFFTHLNIWTHAPVCRVCSAPWDDLAQSTWCTAPGGDTVSTTYEARTGDSHRWSCCPIAAEYAGETARQIHHQGGRSSYCCWASCKQRWRIEMISGFSLVMQPKDFSRSWVREEWTTEMFNTTAEELEPIIECRMYLYLVRMILVARWSLKIAPKIYQFHPFIINIHPTWMCVGIPVPSFSRQFLQIENPFSK